MGDLLTLDAEGLFAVFGPMFLSFGLALTRIGALVATTPLFSSPTVPTPVKAGLVGALTLFVMFSMGPSPHLASLGALQIAAAIVTEIVVGAIMGLAVSVLFGALAFAGQLIGIQMGFAIASVVDPTTFQQVGVLGQVLNLLGLMLLLVFDGHLMLLNALFHSFEVVPLGAASPNGTLIVREVVRQGGLLFTLGLRIALPVACVVLLVNVGLATIARTVPQVNIFVIGFLLTIGLGLLVLGLSIPATAMVFETMVEEAIRSATRMTRYL